MSLTLRIDALMAGIQVLTDHYRICTIGSLHTVRFAFICPYGGALRTLSRTIINRLRIIIIRARIFMHYQTLKHACIHALSYD